ncbi:MAG: dienelactone hydrolase [Actinobacteria bacterium]|nr:MAG: dienelactone hydrolase [Actinomycetota bacterium]REK41102.1 MAG: dienelactone hydrolase [Actinomycetota bacterium]
MARKIKIKWNGDEVTGILDGEGENGILLAHGAGTNQEHVTIVTLRSALAASGHTVMTFNYPYTERGSKRPDRTERLVECHQAAAESFKQDVKRVFLAGRSMGGRMGTYLAAEGYPCDGLILYSYPLHPPGKPEKLRVAHFPDVAQPMLFFQGTRDPLSRMELFDRHIRPLPNARVEILEGANHGFKGGGWDLESMVDRLAAGTTRFVAEIASAA